MRHPALTAALIATALALSACAPKVGTTKWCGKLQEKPKGDWSANDAAAFLQHCVVPGTEVKE
ncbi:MAG: DUF3012 domain-containing protein [Zoogloeaceae bacterium]|nr:DUF3012 domain-containing protein [Zoogloeaceae bacterium]